MTHLTQVGVVHLRAWLVFLAKQTSARGKLRTTRTCRWYAQSMHAFCNWLSVEQYIDENPAERVELPKLEKPLIRIIEFDEFEKLLAACAPPQEQGLIADRNAARNRTILWVLWDHIFLSETGNALTISGIEMLFKRLRSRSGVSGKRISPLQLHRPLFLPPQ